MVIFPDFSRFWLDFTLRLNQDLEVRRISVVQRRESKCPKAVVEVD